MTTPCNADYVVVGDITRDLADGNVYTNGGTVTFAGLLVQRYGQHAGVLTQASAESDAGTLTRSGVWVHRQATDVTTAFENRYFGDLRKQRLSAFSGQIAMNTLPEAWRAAKIAHIGPIFHECPAESLLAFSDSTYVGVTPQGWMRTVDAEGFVSHCRLPDDVVKSLKYASAVIISQEDIDGDLDYAAYLASQCPLLIVTSGWQGGIVYDNGAHPWSFPTPSVNEVDPTGAGDIFASTFFLMHEAGRSVEHAVKIAACVASKSVTRHGLDAIPGRETIQNCINST